MGGIYVKEVVVAEEGEIYDVELAVDLLKANKNIAEKNKALLKKKGVICRTYFMLPCLIKNG